MERREPTPKQVESAPVIGRSSGVLRDTLVIPHSANKKTGQMTVTYRPMDTCPPDCVFLPSGPIGGCYGTGRNFAMAGREAATLTVDKAVELIETRRPKKAKETARYLRDRVIGDVITGQGTLDRDYVQAIAEVAKRLSLIAYGYTHAWTRFTSRDVRFIQRTGYVMNASCETVEDVEAAVGLGLLPTIVNDDLPEGAMIAGYRVVTCPAQTHEDVTCASCGLCAKTQRAALVRFRIHGTAKQRASQAVKSKIRRRKAA